MLLGSMFYAGSLAGNMLGTFVADIMGRRVLLLISSFLSVGALLWNSWASSYAEIVVILFLYGVIFSIALANS